MTLQLLITLLVMLLCVDPPECKSGQKSYYGVERNEKVLVSCELAAKPAELVFHWAFNNSLGEISSGVKFASSGTKSLASIVVAGKDGYGMLTCWGRNRVGAQLEKPCAFFIIPAGNIICFAVANVMLHARQTQLSLFSCFGMVQRCREMQDEARK